MINDRLSSRIEVTEEEEPEKCAVCNKTPQSVTLSSLFPPHQPPNTQKLTQRNWGSESKTNFQLYLKPKQLKDF